MMKINILKVFLILSGPFHDISLTKKKVQLRRFLSAVTVIRHGTKATHGVTAR
ncbi:hypothetical protein IB254_08195 [Pseudomonas sp. PDM03]|uniref:hypothetical protein n=1 Tax=Pseudomonas sp. PDM03 TaxID=2769266 RepID=UPI00177CCD95|nr:hypothetical protein [Pseudomonas sp. PDM03]MBD9587038.1 hypothetical protein [Pseudomonas sp. PDM03]